MVNENRQKVIYYVSLISIGKVTSYGKIADLTGLTPRVVGFILNSFTFEECKDYPWHRVVNRNGFLSSSKLGNKGMLQKQLLESEGIVINDFQINNIEKYWHPYQVTRS